MRRACVAAAVTAGLVAVVTGPAQARLDPEADKERRAEVMTRSLLVACEAYYLNPQSGNTYPKALGDLVMPPWGGLPLTRGRIFDPWRQPYRYEVVPGADGTPQPYVWSERAVNGKTRVYGRKPPRPGKE